MTVDFGYVMNTGPTGAQEIYNETVHDEVAINVELRMSDHPNTIDSGLNEIFVAVKFGDMIIVCKLN